MNDAPNTEQKLLALRSLTEELGSVHQMQLDVLKIWAKIAAPAGAKVTTRLNVLGDDDGNGAKIVHLHYLVRGPESISEAMENSFRESVRWLLGQNWSVCVYRTEEV